MSNRAILYHDMKHGRRGMGIPACYDSTPPSAPVSGISPHESGSLCYLFGRSDAAVDRVCGAQAPRSRELRSRGAENADLLRAAGLELGRPQIGARACAEVDRRVRGLPLCGRAFRVLRRHDPHAFSRGVQGRALHARPGRAARRAHLRAHRISRQGGEAGGCSREFRGRRDLSRFLLGPARARNKGAAAAAPRQGGRPEARRDGGVRNLLRLRRHLFDQVRGDLLRDGREQMRPHPGERRACGGARRPRLHAQHRRAPAPARRREDAGASRGRSPRGRKLMHVQSMHFKPRASEALANATLQANLRKFQSAGFTALRAKAVAEFGPELFENLRGEGAAIRDRSLANLDAWLGRFEAEAVRRGAQVLYAESREEACELLLGICRRHGVKKAIKSKSMLSEGSGVIVTNEGNGRMVTTLPRVHVCMTGIEKVIPTLEDFSTLLRLLTRSATGQPISNYVSLFTGPRGREDSDGPEHMVFILVDGGRTGLVGGDMQEMLRCIRCGACMNHCPVYRAVGGHSYGWVYPGPMGAVLTPSYVGLENALDLPHAATLCGACSVACPVKIPLPELLRKLREKQVDRGLRPRSERAAIRLWSWMARRPRLYALATAIAVRFLRVLGGRNGMIVALPFGREWTRGRFFPAPKSGRTFRSLYASRAKPARNRGQTTVFSSKQQ